MNPGYSLPVAPVEHKKEPDDLFNDCQEEKSDEDKPDDEEYPLIHNINGKHTKAIIVDNGPTGTINIKGALCHLGENIIERISTTRLDIIKLVINNPGTIGKELPLKIPIN